jgi:hypothetical protein
VSSCLSTNKRRSLGRRRHCFETGIPGREFSKELFVRKNSSASVTNVWAMEAEPGRLFAYELRRPGRFFRVEFDLARPAAAAPPPWGAR